jgi:alpha-galactosidase
MVHVSGVEANPNPSQSDQASTPCRQLHLAQHTRLTAVSFEDRTDVFNELAHERHWLLHRSEKLTLKGNLFVFENVLDASGQIAIKCGPLPPMRGVQSPWDVKVFAAKEDGFTAELVEDQAYDWQLIPYTGGILGRTRALHQAQHQMMASHEINFLSNTWGDRSQDARMNEAFILEEIAGAAKLGVEVVQLDDGWQQGRTANSVEAKQAGGRWEGFHDGESKFWTPDPVRFPNGLEPILEAAKQVGIAIGLWYAPDSANGFANWQADVKTVMHLHQHYGVYHFKFDSINTKNREGEINLYRFIDAVLEQSNGKIIVDLDITAGCRPGYLGRIDCGPLFVANRYTDWHGYWPHQVFRMLWQLSWWIEPSRLRFMLLNNNRNTEKYGNDPLAPQQIAPATMFAPLMFCQPLGWFEIANLPASYFQQIKPLVELWKQHRDAMHAGTIMPVGLEPDGVAWSGMISLSDDGKTGYLLVCNGMQTSINLSHDLPVWLKITSVKQLAGMGRLECEDDLTQLTHIPPQAFWFGTFAC